MILALGAVAAMSTTANAQTYKMTITVPFAFHAGDRAFEAGKYMVGKTGYNDTPVLRNAKETVFVIGSAAPVSRNDRAAKLVFRRYGDGQYYLAEVWTDSTIGTEIAPSKTEKREMAAQHEVAMVAVNARLAD